MWGVASKVHRHVCSANNYADENVVHNQIQTYSTRICLDIGQWENPPFFSIQPMAVIEQKAPELFDKDNRPIFTVVKSFTRTQCNDKLSISALALSPDSDLLAIGYASGIVEVAIFC